MSSSGKCPFGHGSVKPAGEGRNNRDWWPNQLNLKILNQQSSPSNPMGEDFDYHTEFAKLDYQALKKDLFDLMTDSKDWWPADFGHYGGFMVRMAWHSAGTYRAADGRGGGARGQQRFAPLNSWPDNANLDKARRLLWPVKQKYGNKISWADLFILAGNCAIESMGGKTLGFAGGRVDTWEPEDHINWGDEDVWLNSDKRFAGKGRENGNVENLDGPLGAVHMGLIYVNPEGPEGNPDPKLAANDIREAFGRMAMTDEETVALIAGGHTFGKAHGATGDSKIGPEPEAAKIQEQGFGWANGEGLGNEKDTFTSGLEVTWTRTPNKWSHDFFDILFKYEWELTKSPAGANQWVAKDAEEIIPDAFDSNKKHKPTMLTTDLSLRFDPEFEKISRLFLEDPSYFQDAFAKAWFKLTHRDLGPVSVYKGEEIPKEVFAWQDPLPQDSSVISDSDVSSLKSEILNSGVSLSDFISVAWNSAASFRSSDRRGGANGARIRLAPQKDWQSNEPEKLSNVLSVLEKIKSGSSSKVSIADLIVLAGSVAIESAAEKAGYKTQVPFESGRVDAGEEHTDAESFEALEPLFDGFRNYQRQGLGAFSEKMLVDKAQLLDLTVPEMTVLVGGLRVLGANYQCSKDGVFTDNVGTLSNDFFVNLLDQNLVWKETDADEQHFEGRRRGDNEVLFTASRVDLIFGSNSQLRAIAEVYGSDDAKEKFVQDFVKAWVKVMNLDRFDLK